MEEDTPREEQPPPGSDLLVLDHSMMVPEAGPPHPPAASDVLPLDA